MRQSTPQVSAVRLAPGSQRRNVLRQLGRNKSLFCSIRLFFAAVEPDLHPRRPVEMIDMIDCLVRHVSAHLLDVGCQTSSLLGEIRRQIGAVENNIYISKSPMLLRGPLGERAANPRWIVRQQSQLLLFLAGRLQLEHEEIIGVVEDRKATRRHQFRYETVVAIGVDRRQLDLGADRQHEDQVVAGQKSVCTRLPVNLVVSRTAQKILGYRLADHRGMQVGKSERHHLARSHHQGVPFRVHSVQQVGDHRFGARAQGRRQNAACIVVQPRRQCLEATVGQHEVRVHQDEPSADLAGTAGLNPPCVGHRQGNAVQARRDQIVDIDKADGADTPQSSECRLDLKSLAARPRRHDQDFEIHFLSQTGKVARSKVRRQ